jgi:hypothetical protein
MHLVYFWPSPTSMARWERQLWAPTVQWWVGTVRFYVQKMGWIIISIMQHAPILATFDTTPSPHGRINAPSLLLAFAHIQGEAGTPTLGTYSAVVGRNGPFLCAEGVDYDFHHATKTPPFSLHSTHTPSPHGRINAPCLLLAFAHIHGEVGTPTLATYSAVVGRNGPCLCLCRRWGGLLFPSCNKNAPILATFDTHPVSARANQCT